MADRRIVDVVLPFVDSHMEDEISKNTGTEIFPLYEIGAEYTVPGNRKLRIEDSIGPSFKVVFRSLRPKDDRIPKEPVAHASLVLLTVEVFKLRMMGNRHEQAMTACVYKRNLSENLYSSELASYEIMGRYRTPFEECEQSIPSENFCGEYQGNPDINLSSGNSVVARVTSPWPIEVEKSNVTLQFVEFFGHIGPKKIKVT